MALVDLVRIKIVSATPTALSLGAPSEGYRGVETLTNGEEYSYAIIQDGNYEIGRGIYLTDGTRLTRSIIASSSGGIAIDLGPNAEVGFVALAQDLATPAFLFPLSGAEAPGDDVGAIGQFYFQTSTPVQLWGPKSSAGWGAGVPIVGDAGPASAYRANLSALQAADVTDGVSIFNGAIWAWTLGNYGTLIDNIDYVKSDDYSSGTGAWVRQQLGNVNSKFGLFLTGWLGSGPRPRGQLTLQNLDGIPTTEENHVILTLFDLMADEEGAVEFVGRGSDGTAYQRGAAFARWWRGINNPATKEGLFAWHGVYAGQDNTPFIVLNRNTVIANAGDTSGKPWEWDPPANFFWVYTKQKIGTSLFIGPSTKWDTNTGSGYRLEVEGHVAVGEVVGTAMGRSVQFGYSTAGDTGFIQAFDGSAFRKLTINGSEISMGLVGQKLGFLGASPVVRPTVTGNLSGSTTAGNNAVLGSLIIALTNLGLITNGTT